MTSTVRIGLLGCGVVGGSLAELLHERGEAIAARTGLTFEISRVAVRDLSKSRPAVLDSAAFTTDAEEIVKDPAIDVVVELIGGIEPARALVAAALEGGKPVVTGNKALLAEAGASLFALADGADVDLLFEAAIAGGIPFVRPLRESLAGEHISRIMGIFNGTTNFILTKMTEEGADYAEALAEAKALGFAEADPTADVEGHDAAAKAAIVGSLAYGATIVQSDVHTEGITSVTSDDIEHARKLGYVVKLLAVIEAVDAGGSAGVAVRVHPTMVPSTHPLAAVRESFNAVFVEGDSVGDLMFYGRGAGGAPTASAVLGDVIDAATNLRKGTHATIAAPEPVQLVPMSELTSAFYLNIDVHDRPGVLAAVAGVLGQHGVSIRSMEQIGLGDDARLAFITHEAGEAAMQATLAQLNGLDAVDKINSVLRVLEVDE